jgi:hypothetical protein
MKLEIVFDVVLKGDSCFWVITRSKDKLGKNSAIIKLSKELNSQKVFASFGTYVHDDKGELFFKVFLKQQLLDFASKLYYINRN